VFEFGSLYGWSWLCVRAAPDGELPEELARLDAQLLEQVCNEVMHSGGLVQWDDIAGQFHAKQLVQEMVVWPMMNPHIFKVSSLHLSTVLKDVITLGYSQEINQTGFHAHYFYLCLMAQMAITSVE
jgi:hypothetical protein